MGKDLKTLFSALVLAASVVASGLAQAAPIISWQTEPVLGYSSSMGAGPGFNTGSGNWINSVYVATGTGVITIPQFSIPSDIFFGVGGPSVPTFVNTASLVVWNGSAVNYVAGNTYNITERWDYITLPFIGNIHGRAIGSLIDPPGTFSDGANTIAFWHSDNLPFLNILPNGNWTYTQTWTNTSIPADFVTFTRPFTVVPIPEPETYAMMLAGLGLMGFVARRRRQKEVA